MEQSEAQSHPKAFISYSWSSPSHEDWVLDLANELSDNGVDVVIDKWCLREGADKYKFMESMVTDPTIRKVLIVSDHEYARKADARERGVGAETQIISKELYDQVDSIGQQQKFVVVIAEVNEKDDPFTPVSIAALV